MFDMLMSLSIDEMLNRLGWRAFPSWAGMRDYLMYEGPAYAQCDWGPHYSTTSRCIYVVLGSAFPLSPVMVAEVTIATADAIQARGIAAPVWVKIHQRGMGRPRITELYLLNERQQERPKTSQSDARQPVGEPVKDYYETLGVKRDATQAQIKRAFRKLAKTCHPDLFPGDKEKEQRFKDISEAYEVLDDADKRAQYHRKLHP